MSEQAERRYWVSRADGEDWGDYAGFSVDTWEEALTMIREEQEEERRLVANGYYEPDYGVMVGRIDCLVVLESHLIEPIPPTEEVTGE